MSGTLYVVNRAGQRFVFDPNGLSFNSEAAPAEGHSTIVIKPKVHPKPKPQPKPIETKGTLPPKPIDIDMSFVGGLPEGIEAHNLWLATGATAPGISAVKGSVTLDFLKTSVRNIPEGQHRVLVLEPDDAR